MRDHLSGIVERAIERGNLSPDVDPREAANDLAGSLFYKKLVVHEKVDMAYVEARVDRWLVQVGRRPSDG